MYFDPLNNFHKSTIGAIKEQEKFALRITGEFSDVNLVIRKDNDIEEKKVAMIKNSDFFECYISLDSGLYWYYFQTDKGIISLGDDYCGELDKELFDVVPFQLCVYSADYSVPEWLGGGIIYQIFPDRFFIGRINKNVPKGKVLHKNIKDTPIFLPNEQGEVLNNDFFGGDLLGITLKIPYLASLGVTAIYLNPIFEAFSNHRYDTADYMSIDSMLGTKSDFVNLINTANENNIKIIIDGVFNHTGSDSIYFNKNGNYSEVGAYQSKNSPYFKWYKFVEYPNLYESWWGIKTLPAIDKTCKDYMDFIAGEKGVIDYYLRLGVYGIRLDVVDELPSHFVRKIRKAVKSVNPNAAIIGEVWEDASNKISYGIRREYFLGKELDSVMNYPLKDAIIDFSKTGNCEHLLKVIKEQIDHYPAMTLKVLMNILSTHDTFRLISALSDKNVQGLSKTEMSKIKLDEAEQKLCEKRVKIASLLLYTLYGVVSIYYGDEVGMEGYADPLNRKFFEWDKVGNDLNKWFIKLGEARKKYSSFGKGNFVEVYCKNGIMVYKMIDENCETLVAINNGLREIRLDFEGELLEILSNKRYLKKVVLNVGEFGIFIKESVDFKSDNTLAF